MISPALEQLFEDPPRDFGPTPLWWWSGAKVTRERLAWQMRGFAEGGIHNLVVINLAPAGPSFGARADEPAWFGEEWWERFTDACEIARDLGTRLWFYDQIGFSGANVQGSVTRRHPEAAGRALRSRRAVVSGGTVALEGPETLVGAYDMTGARLSVTDTARITVADGSEVQLVVSVPTAFDYLDPHAVGLLLDAVHHEYDRRVPEYLGNVIAGSFQDELPGTNSWSRRFPEEFRSRRGYDLLDHLPALFDDTARATRIRADYYAVRAELTEEALFRPLAAWHDERGMLLGCDQSNPARAGYPAQSTQLYTDYFRTHRWYGAAGSDHHGDAKVHSSMAHLYGHERVWIEAFHSSGWGGTLEDTYDWLLPFLRSGANLYNPHASYFGTAGGWFEWAPPSTDWRQPYWQQYPAFSRAVARICSILSWGTYSADVAVLHPTATMQALLPLDAPVQHFGDGRLGDRHTDVDETQRHYLELCGTNNWLGPRIGALDRHRLSFDVIDDASVQRAGAADGALRIRDLAYTAVLLPSASVLEEETARRLTELLDAGGRVVVVGRPPAAAAGLAGDDSVVAALLAHPRLERVSDAEAGAAAVADTAGYATGDVPLLVRRKDDVAVALVTGAFPDARTHPPRGHHDIDPARYAHSSSVTVRAAIAEAEVWNPATGDRRPGRVTVSDGVSTIEVPLEGAPAALVVWREGTPAARTTTPPSGPVETLDVSTGWEGRLVLTMDNTWGDLALPAGSSVAEPQIWSMRWTETDAWGERTRVTYGNRVRVLHPVPSEKAPDPLDSAAVERILAGELPLVPPDAGWGVSLYSSSRGIPDPDGLLGNKGLVAEEFVRVPVPGSATVARVRSIVETDHRGPADLHIGAAAAKRVWWNGELLDTGSGYLASARVDVAQPRNVLEYELADAQDRPLLISGAAGTPLGSYFCLSRPDGFTARPQFMSLPDDVRPDGRVTYRARLRLPNPGAEAVLVVGAAAGVTVLLDGDVVARQEKVEYYEADWGAVPMFFRHPLTLRAGEHVLEVVADSVHARDAVFVDLVASAGSSATALVSGAGWAAQTGQWRGHTVEHEGRWGELQHCYAAVRPHPLPDAEWLTGAPVLGAAVLPLRSTDDVRARAQRFRFTVPPGTVSVDLPLELPARVRVGNGTEQLLDGGGELTLDQPLGVPTEIEVVTAPTAVLRGGSAWRGPVRVRTVPAPLPLGDWRSLGLGGWSGGVTYTRSLEVPAGLDPVLDLGRVRGSVAVFLDGEPVGEAFCAPYRFELCGAAGRTVRVDVTVHNTLAPYLAEATPTAWAFPSQLSSGLLGPVTLRIPGLDADR
ncbi:glycosyl hydrolase [Streptomyces sp. NL15-2K]|uniref:glycosyl hydrolase n=1 Tax=Streptomyces sp. NL15-2K TaxID=376149 RepID=UPI000F585702|nr:MULTISPECIES: glycosyl hydrolase [Actinomycetes]WKX15079.1 glycosyl hydrolase [Kutzneria buriramensis]GCB52164.1 glycoside hydrolase family 2 [Streptomyces sp. NL15-2K]